MRQLTRNTLDVSLRQATVQDARWSDYVAVQHARDTVWCDCAAWSRLRQSHPRDIRGSLQETQEVFLRFFVDLVKAFDRVIRELVFGIRPGVADVSKQLRDLGLAVSQLNFVTSFIARHGSLFKVIGAHPRVVQLVCILFASSWVSWNLPSSFELEEDRGVSSGEWCSTNRTHWPHGIERRVVQQRNRHAHT